MSSNGQLFKILVYWFGSIQALHFGVLIRAAFIYQAQHIIIFPAPPPVDGWSEQAMFFLLALGITDSLLIVLSLIFVYGFLTGKIWYPLIGFCASGASIVTALVFALGTIPAGAWQAHPFSYAVITLIFLPFLLLFGQLYKMSSVHKKNINN